MKQVQKSVSLPDIDIKLFLYKIPQCNCAAGFMGFVFSSSGAFLLPSQGMCGGVTFTSLCGLAYTLCFECCGQTAASIGMPIGNHTSPFLVLSDIFSFLLRPLHSIEEFRKVAVASSSMLSSCEREQVSFLV